MFRCSAGAVVAVTVVTGLCNHETGLAQEPMRLGAEFQINTVTASDEGPSRVDLDSNGDFVAIWVSSTQDGSQQGVFGQRYASSGAKLGAEFQVNTYTFGFQFSHAVGADADGDFVVTWHSSGQDGSGEGVFARRFSSAGAALGTEFQVNAYTNGDQLLAAVAREADGGFVIAWESGQDGSGLGVFARRFDSAGVGQGSELQVNTYTTLDQEAPAIDLDEDGDFVVTWTSDGQDGSGPGVFGQRFNSLGVRQGPEFQVNSYVTDAQSHSAVGVDADGDFVVTYDGVGRDDFGHEDPSLNVFARRFDSTGAPRGTEMQVNVYATGNQAKPSLGIDRDGDFVVAWESYQDGSQYGVFARHFRSSGIPTSGELLVNTTVVGNQRYPAVRSDSDGDFVVSWTSVGQDGAGMGVFGQRFDGPTILDIDGDGQLGALTDGLLVLRFFFGFTGSTLTSGAVGASCTRCDSSTILPYLQSLT